VHTSAVGYAPAAVVVAGPGGADDVAEVAVVAADVAADEAAGGGAGGVPVLQAPSAARLVTSTAIEGATQFIAVPFVEVVPWLVPGRRG